MFVIKLVRCYIS